MSRWLLYSVLLAFGSTNIAAGHALTPAIAKAKHLPVLKEAVAFVNSGLGRRVLVFGMSLALICTQVGCGTDDMDEAPQVVTQVADEDTSSDDIEGGAYEARDYLGNYIAYVGHGDGSISTGYVTSYLSKPGKLILESEDEDGWEWEKEEEEISVHAVVGVMHQTHALAGEEVSFKRVNGAMPLLWGDDLLPDHLYGTVDVVYVAAVLPEGSGEPTAVGVTVHSGDFAGRKVVVQWPFTVFLPIGRVEFTDADE